MTYPPPAQQGFAASDDAFHILRDCRSLYLKELGALLRQEESIAEEAIDAFEQAVGAYFDQMLVSGPRSGFASSDGLTASRISLVGENDLELEIRLGEFSAHLLDRSSGQLWRVHLRFVTLLQRPDLSTADNPISPRGIALGLLEYCRKLGENHAATLARVDRLEHSLVRTLGPLYARLSDFLASRHVGAATPSIITAPESKAYRTIANPAGVLQRHLLGPLGDSVLQEGGTVAGVLSGPMLEKLFTRLDDLEKDGKLPESRDTSSSTTNYSLESLIPGLFANPKPAPPTVPVPLNAQALGVPSGAPEAATIDTLALIFATIFATPELPDALKAILARLQIPLLKAAMVDATFFTGSNHPVRQLLDGIARAALGLPNNVDAKDALCLGIESIAARLHGESLKDATFFQQLQTDLKNLIAARDQAVARHAEAYFPLLQQLARRHQAQYRCRQIVEQHLAAGAPARIAEFLHQYWQKVMVIIWMRHGEQGSEWVAHKGLISDLLWSIQPKTDMEERKRLAKILQPMLQTLNAGMALINTPADVQSAFLDYCFVLQTAAMRGAPLVKDEIAVPAEPPAAENEFELRAAERVLRVIDFPSAATPDAGLSLPIGAWLRLPQVDAVTPVGRLCRISSDGDWYLIANPAWSFSLAIHAKMLDSMLLNGAARNCTDDSLFDDAAELALIRSTQV